MAFIRSFGLGLLGLLATSPAMGLFEIVTSGTPAQLRAALVKGADLKMRNQDGATPFLIACGHCDNPVMIRILLDAGADLKDRDNDGDGPLMYAAGDNRNVEIIQMLIDAKCPLDEQDKDGDTALMLAALSNENPEVVLALLQAGANPRLENKDEANAFDMIEENASMRGTQAFARLKRACQ